MKTYKYHIYLRDVAGNEKRLAPVPIGNTNGIQVALRLYACRLFGHGGKDWRIVRDKTLIGFHVMVEVHSTISG